jgi:hypothetical protein
MVLQSTVVSFKRADEQVSIHRLSIQLYALSHIKEMWRAKTTSGISSLPQDAVQHCRCGALAFGSSNVDETQFLKLVEQTSTLRILVA